MGLAWYKNGQKGAAGKPVADTVAVYLSADAQKELKEHLATHLGIPDAESRLVVLKRGPDDDEEFIMSALFGGPCAFRLKGIIKSERGIVGTGTVSTLGGKLKMANYTVGMPVLQKGGEASFNLNESLDMATRVARASGAKAPWKGRVPAVTTESGETYPAVSVDFTALPLDKQIVVGGTLCSSKYALMNGRDMQCNFKLGVTDGLGVDDSKAKVVDDNVEKKKEKPLAEVKAAEGAEGGGEEAGEGECPLCAYVKKGSCKDEFMTLQSFHDTEGAEGFDMDAFKRVAQEMYDCMAKDEYYDAFVMDLKRQTAEAAAEVAAEAEAVAKPTADTKAPKGTEKK
jgi:hypothetical protein